MPARSRTRLNESAPDPWLDIGRISGPAAALAGAVGAMASARGLDPDGAEHFLGPAAPGSTHLPPPRAVEDLGLLLQSFDEASSRKANGAYFTPPALAEALTEAVLRPLASEPHTSSVVDPSCGAGIFLLHAVRFVARTAGPEAATGFVARGVAGVDRDPLAVRVCRASLWLEAQSQDLDPATLDTRIVEGDALLGVDAERAARWPGAIDTTWPDPSTPQGRDLWCALWFWPDRATRPATAEALDRDARDRGQQIARELGFLHWDLAFPAESARGGFDVVLGNPPWDIDRPDAREFFERYDDGHRRRHKQDALRVQRALRAGTPQIAARWHLEQARFAARAAFCRDRFRLRPRTGAPNAYQRFVELGLHLLRDGGRLGMLVPAGLYADLGSRDLRRTLLDQHRWERMCGFENRAHLFPGVDSRFKIAAIVVSKGGTTRTVRTSFMGRRADALREPGVPVTRASISRLSPRSLALVEVQQARSLALLEKLHQRGVPLADQGRTGWGVTFRRELDLTSDSHRFVPAAHGEQGELLPLWEGRMIGPFDFAEKGWVEGHGRRAAWRDIGWPDKTIEPRHFVSAAELRRIDPTPDRPKVGFMAIGSATNTRTMIATVLWRAPCGNSVPVLRCRPAPDGSPGELALCAALNSFVYDFALRLRMAGNNLNRFVLDETALPPRGALAGIEGLAAAVASLCWTAPWFDEAWPTLSSIERSAARPIRDPFPRRRMRAALDAVVAAAWGIDPDELRFVLESCQQPTEALRRGAGNGALDPKGLWRVDRQLPPAERQPALAIAFRDQLARGLTPSELLATATSREAVETS